MKKLSIIIPYYNGEQWVGTCLDSLLRQGLPAEDYEVIVVDDGSTHNTETLMHYVEDHTQIHYLYQENQRHAAARNYGLTVAQGEYVFFCDSDDFVADNVLGHLCDIAREESADVLLFCYSRLQEGEEPALPKRYFDCRDRYESGKAYMSQPPYQFSGGVWQFLIRRGFMIEKDLQFDKKMINREEHLFFLQMMLAAGKVVKVDVNAYYYVQHPTSWVHLEGRVNNSEAYIDCMVRYLQYLNRTQRRLAVEGVVSSELLEKMRKREAYDSFTILLNAVCFLPVKDNLAMARRLGELGFYPIRLSLSRHDWARRVANIYPLWLALCAGFHLIPRKLRNNVLNVIKGKMS